MQPTKRETDEAVLRPTLLVDGDASPRADDGADAGGAILTLLPRSPASRFQREREFIFQCRGSDARGGAGRRWPSGNHQALPSQCRSQAEHHGAHPTRPADDKPS
jgi:hypothetical protein